MRRTFKQKLYLSVRKVRLIVTKEKDAFVGEIVTAQVTGNNENK